MGRGRAGRLCSRHCRPHASAGQASEGPLHERGAQGQSGGRGGLAGSSCAWRRQQAQLLPVQKPPLALRHWHATHCPRLRRSAEQLKCPHICRQHQGHAGGDKSGIELGGGISGKGAAGIRQRSKLSESGAGQKKASLGWQGASLRQGAELGWAPQRQAAQGSSSSRGQQGLPAGRLHGREQGASSSIRGGGEL